MALVHLPFDQNTFNGIRSALLKHSIKKIGLPPGKFVRIVTSL
jgi:hypothetical protein